MKKKDVSIIIVNWNAGVLLKNCIESIIRYTDGISYEIIIVDNASRKESLICIREFENIDFIKFIFLDENIGFAKANNIGVYHSSGEYILFLNPDTLLIDNSIQSLLRSYEKLCKVYKIGVLIPELLNEDKTIQFSAQNFPILSFKRIIKSIYVRITKKIPKSGPRKVEWARGACFFIPRFLGNSYGFWNEHFFLYGEDLEMCYRYTRYGYDTIIDPEIKILHYYNQSGKQRFDYFQSLVKKEEGLQLFYKIYLGEFSFLVLEICLLIKGFIDILKRRDYDRFNLSVKFIKKIFWELVKSKKINILS